MDGLIPVALGGETLLVHRDCLKDHERLGWRVVALPQPAADPQPESMPPEPKRRRASTKE